MKMDLSLEQASNMEAGRAEYPVTPTLLSIDEKSEGHLSTSSTDSSTKPLNKPPESQCKTPRIALFDPK